VGGSQEEGHIIKAGGGGGTEGVAMDGVLDTRTGVVTRAGGGEAMEGGESPFLVVQLLVSVVVSAGGCFSKVLALCLQGLSTHLTRRLAGV
jgi:hypothetical protein